MFSIVRSHEKRPQLLEILTSTTMALIFEPLCRGHYKTSIYPDNEIVITPIPAPRVHKRTSRTKELAEEIDTIGVMADAMHEKPFEEVASWMSEALGLSKDLNSHKQGKRKKPKGLTLNGSRVVRNSAILLQRLAHKDLLSFITLTLPPIFSNTRSLFLSEAVRQFNQWLKRRLKKADIPELVVGCYEIQMKRWEERGEFALHLHLICQGRIRGKTWAIAPQELTAAWERFLENAYGEVIPEDQKGASTNIARVRKSAAQYLSKYISKGGALPDEEYEALQEDYFPSQWHTVSKSMMGLYQAAVEKFEGEEVTALLQVLPTASRSLVRWGRHVFFGVGLESGTWCAWRGFLTLAGRNLVLESLRPT
jgi:hypothetical protein